MVPLAKLSTDPYNLFEGQLLALRGNGPYKGRFYYDWKASPNTKVNPPQIQASMSRKGLKLRWAKQSKAKAYEIVWNTKNQECDEFVQLTKT